MKSPVPARSAASNLGTWRAITLVTAIAAIPAADCQRDRPSFATSSGFSHHSYRPTSTVRFTIEGSPNSGPVWLGSPLSFSPDGRSLVYALGGRILLCKLDEFDSKPIGVVASLIFFSPDGAWLGFAEVDGRPSRISLIDGTVTSMGDVVISRGASWGPDGTLLFAPSISSGLWQITPGSGSPTEVTSLDSSRGEITHRWPEILPGGEAALFTIRTRNMPSFDDAEIAVVNLKSRDRRVLLAGGTYPRYMTTGHLLFVRAGILLAAPFDLERLRVTGEAVPVLHGVAMLPTTGSALFAVSATGALAYASSRVDTLLSDLVWIDRRGRARPFGDVGCILEDTRFSPDGQRLAFTIVWAQNDIGVYDLETRSLARLTSDPAEDMRPVWSPDGRWIAFSSSRTGNLCLFRRRADGSGEDELLLCGEHDLMPSSWSPDGKLLLYAENNPRTLDDIWVLPLDGERAPRLWLRTPLADREAQFSPDGRWVAYTSGDDVYVRSALDSGDRPRRVSSAGGQQPIWPQSGNEILYRTNNQMMAVVVETHGQLVVGKHRLLFAGPPYQFLDAAPDGQSFVASVGSSTWNPTQVNVVMNWSDELRKLISQGRGERQPMVD